MGISQIEANGCFATLSVNEEEFSHGGTGTEMDEGFRADMIIQGKVIVELKSVERVGAAHKKQLLTYLKLTG